MKNVKYCFVLGALLLLSGACTPIEDDELRDKYVTNAGAPITPEELTAALEVTQPYPNSADAVEGDQYIHLKNNRPEIGGVWHVGNKTFQTDDKIVVMEANGVYDIYYTAVSNNAIVSSIPVQVTVTNVFDEWMGFLTGAVDKTDMTAKKTWGFRQGLAAVCDMCAHGYWKYASAGYTPESFAGITWWGAVTYETAGDQTMVFEVDGNKLTTMRIVMADIELDDNVPVTPDAFNQGGRKAFNINLGATPQEQGASEFSVTVTVKDGAGAEVGTVTLPLYFGYSGPTQSGETV